MHEGKTLIAGLSVENISLGGAFVRTLTPLPKGTAVVLDLVRPGLKRAIVLTGRVAGTVTADQAKELRSAPGMGIQFDAMSGDNSERLHALLRSLGAEPALLEADQPPASASEQWPDVQGLIEPSPLEVAQQVPPPPAPPPLAVTPIAVTPIAVTPIAEAPLELARPPSGSKAKQAAAPEPEPTPPPRPSSPAQLGGVAPGVAVPEGAKLMVQVRGLLMELGEAQNRVAVLERQNSSLSAEIDRLTALLEEARTKPRRG